MPAEERTPASETQPDDTSPEATLAAFETAEWEIWPRKGCPIPSNERWAEIGSDLLVGARIA